LLIVAILGLVLTIAFAVRVLTCNRALQMYDTIDKIMERDKA
jgi:hypothetical protein